MLLLSLILMRCEEAPPSEENRKTARASTGVEHAVRTDRESYELRQGKWGPETTIVSTFRAPRDRTVYVVNCNGAINVGLQRLTGTRWVDAWAPEMNACFSNPIEISPGGERTYAVTVVSRAEAPDPSQRTEQRIESGSYRVVWYGVLTSFDPREMRNQEELPLEQRVSAPIEIVREARALR